MVLGYTLSLTCLQPVDSFHWGVSRVVVFATDGNVLQTFPTVSREEPGAPCTVTAALVLGARIYRPLGE